MKKIVAVWLVLLSIVFCSVGCQKSDTNKKSDIFLSDVQMYVNEYFPAQKFYKLSFGYIYEEDKLYPMHKVHATIKYDSEDDAESNFINYEIAINGYKPIHYSDLANYYLCKNSCITIFTQLDSKDFQTLDKSFTIKIYAISSDNYNEEPTETIITQKSFNIREIIPQTMLN